jgi:hypothetical protein
VITAAEPLTIAYLALGARNALEEERRRHADDRIERLKERFGGELGIVEHVISFALPLDALFESITGNMDDWTGVYAYDICEVIGAEVVRWEMLEGPEDFPLETHARPRIEEHNK